MIRAVLFDLGGVLEEVVAAPRIEAWTQGRIPVDEFWHRWLTAGSVRRFESGRLSTAEFGPLAVSELGLEISAELFLKDFESWLAGPLPGARELVEHVRSMGLAVASFSNSNAVHWPIMEIHQRTSTTFDNNFPSHLLGFCKPDVEAFQAVLKAWNRPAHEILFLDDNLLNVEGARQAGMHAEHALGPAAAEAVLRQLRLIGS